MPVNGNYPLTEWVEVYRTGQPVVDRFGNKQPSLDHWVRVKVFGWAVNQTSEGDHSSVLRTYDQLTVYMPHKTAPAPPEKIKLPRLDNSFRSPCYLPSDCTTDYLGVAASMDSETCL